MTNVSLGDILFIVLVFGIICACLQLAKKASKPSGEKKESGND